MTYARRRDRNHTEVRDFLRARGWKVKDTASLGDGMGDFLVSRAGWAGVVEVKDGEKSPSRRKLTEAEIKFSQEYEGPYFVCTSPEDAEHQLRFAWEGLRHLTKNL